MFFKVTSCVHAPPDIVESLHSRPGTSSVHCEADSLIGTILRLTLWSAWILSERFYGMHNLWPTFHRLFNVQLNSLCTLLQQTICHV